MWTLRAVKQQTQTTEAAAAWAMILESREDVVTTMLQLRFFLEVNHDTIDQKLPETMSQMLRLAVNWQKVSRSEPFNILRANYLALQKCNETIYAGTLRDQNDDEVCSFHDGTVLAQRQKMSAWSWMARE